MKFEVEVKIGFVLDESRINELNGEEAFEMFKKRILDVEYVEIREVDVQGRTIDDKESRDAINKSIMDQFRKMRGEA